VSDRRGTAVRVAALGAALLGLLALVALASRAGLPWTGTSEGSEGRSLALVGRLAADALLVGFAALLVGVLVLQVRRASLGLGRGAPEEEEDDEEERPGGRLARLVLRVLPYGLLTLVIGLTFLFAREVDRRFPRGEEARPGTAGAEPGREGPLAPPADAAAWVLAAAGALVLLALVAAFALVVARRRRAAREADEELRTVAVARVLDESIDDLWAEADPRRAVIAAYARMERGLGARGYGRRPFEAPLEYVSRVLSELGAGREPVRRLTALFERAKFSRHAVGPEAKAEAIECLVAIRSGLS
jgi:Domain of unknown function (DUF4129)